jgi:hypothetical protein
MQERFPCGSFKRDQIIRYKRINSWKEIFNHERGTYRYIVEIAVTELIYHFFCVPQLKKDLDALAEMDITNKPVLRLAKSDQNSLLAAVERDITFLKQLNLMDYSLLIGVEGVSRDDLMSVDGAPTAGGRDEVLEVVAARKRLRDSDHCHKDSYRYVSVLILYRVSCSQLTRDDSHTALTLHIISYC